MSVIIRLQNLPLAANASDVRSFFKGLSIPDGGVHIVGGALGDAFIAFSTDEDARQAMSLNGGFIKNGPVSLLLSSRAEMQKVIDQARKAALAYMQLKQGAAPPAAAAVLPKAAIPQNNNNSIPTDLIPGVNKKVNPLASLSSFNVQPLAKAIPAAVQQPQPPVISLAGFLAKVSAGQLNKVPTVAPAVASTTATAAPVASLSPLLAPGSAYNEIPGLSFLSSDGRAPAGGDVGMVSPLAGNATQLNTNGALTDWLSALNGSGANGGPVANNDVVVPRPIIVNDSSPWKFLKKDRRSRSRSVSRERSYRRSSRSSSRERDGRRRSRSSSRDRRQKRNRNSRSSSRERTNRWSRSSSREYGRNRSRSSRSRSSSRDRFGRTRQRSRSRSRDRRRSDSNSRDRYDGTSNSGRSNRVSRFSDRGTSDFSGQQQSQQNPMNSVFATGMNQTVEPIYGLHTIPGVMMDGGGRSRFQPGHFSTISGKISPSPFGNGMMNSGGVFRNTSPLPDSVYSSTSTKPMINNNGPATSDFAVKLSNFELSTGYGEIRRFFKSHMISTQGIKMINDQNGRRTGVAFIQFLRKEGKQNALMRDGTLMRRTRVRIESITDQEFESAIDSFRPGNETKQQDQQGWRDGRSVNPWNMTHEDHKSPRDGGGDSNERHRNRNESAGNDTTGQATTLTVWNLPSFTTEQDIMKMFSDFTVVEVLIVRNHYAPKQMDGYVKFHRPEDAREAWSQLHRHYIGNKKVTVRTCEEIDYEVAKNEYENPGSVEDNSPSEEQQHNNGQNEQANDPTNNSDSENINGNNSNNGGSDDNGQQCRANKQGSTRWGSVERNWDEQNDTPAPSNNLMDGQRRLDGDSGAHSDTSSSWNNRDPRRQREDDSGEHGDDSNSNFNNNANMNNSNNQHSRDPRKSHNRFSGGNSSVDNSEMFQRTNWLLLRSVDFHVYEEDVYAFFGNDGFQAKSVLLVHNERGGRTGECLVEFGSQSEAHHAESKSSQYLGRRKVFASHLDRGQVADLMARFSAIAQGLQPSFWLPDHLQNGDNNGNGNNGPEQNDDDDPEKNQGVGCGPYRTSTVGLLNLAYKTSIEDVQHFFQEFNLPPENIRRRFLDNGQPTGEAMVRFQNHHDAEKALNEYQNRRLFGRNVRIRLINDD